MLGSENVTLHWNAFPAGYRLLVTVTPAPRLVTRSRPGTAGTYGTSSRGNLDLFRLLARRTDYVAKIDWYATAVYLLLRLTRIFR